MSDDGELMRYDIPLHPNLPENCTPTPTPKVVNDLYKNSS